MIEDLGCEYGHMARMVKDLESAASLVITQVFHICHNATQCHIGTCHITVSHLATSKTDTVDNFLQIRNIFN